MHLRCARCACWVMQQAAHDFLALFVSVRLLVCNLWFLHTACSMLKCGQNVSTSGLLYMQKNPPQQRRGTASTGTKTLASWPAEKQHPPKHTSSPAPPKAALAQQPCQCCSLIRPPSSVCCCQQQLLSPAGPAAACSAAQPLPLCLCCRQLQLLPKPPAAVPFAAN